MTKSRYITKRNAIYAISILITIAFLLFGIRSRRIENEIQYNGVIVTAKIVEYLPTVKGMQSANYLCEFTFNDSVRRLVSPSSVKSNRSDVVGKSFPALFSDRTNTLRILIYDEDFERYNVVDTFSLGN